MRLIAKLWTTLLAAGTGCEAPSDPRLAADAGLAPLAERVCLSPITSAFLR